MAVRRIILLFGLLNAMLYAGLLPLWEGFDEAFHYGYVETLWQTGRLPVLGKTLVPMDVAKSFQVAPMSYIVHRSIQESTSFDDWLRLPSVEKQRRRTALDELRPGAGDSTRPNYEAHQPPLAYVLLTPFDWALQRAPTAIRVLCLRLLSGVMSIVLVYFGMTSLCRTFELPETFANAALFTVFCSQMLYATVAHVANDWLAVGVGAVFIAALAEHVRKPNKRSARRAILWLAAGLLTKAYFLALLPVALVACRRFKAACALLVLAAPWYTRNVMLYRNISGTHEQFKGIGIRQALGALPQIDWIATAGFLARGSLWTGNNSFTNFSRSTLNFVLLLLCVAVGAWAAHRSSIQPAERIVAASIVVFSLAIAYATCASFADTKGESAGASPWYSQLLLVPVFSLAWLGTARLKRYGSGLALLITASSAWILMATWLLKLFPMYSGAGAAPMRVREIWNWYAHGGGDLSLMALAPAPLLYTGLVASVLLAIGLSGRLITTLTVRGEIR